MRFWKFWLSIMSVCVVLLRRSRRIVLWSKFLFVLLRLVFLLYFVVLFLLWFFLLRRLMFLWSRRRRMIRSVVLF